MITSEEARKLSKEFRKNSLQLNAELKLFGVRQICQKNIYNKQHNILDDYITQQEKVNELLEMYRKREINRNLPHPSHADEIIYTRKIDKLESELNDNK